MSIAFFGASITQQKTGYVNYFKKMNSEYNIYQLGYGGMYIRDAGICFIDHVIQIMPKYCFLDWFSPECYRPPENIKEYLDPIIEKLLSINCHPILLFFYRKQMDNGWFSMFNYLKEYTKEYQLNYIDLSKINNPDIYLRDSIHTNDLGSKMYSEIITDQFNSMSFPETYADIPSKNKWSTINILDMNIIAKKHIKLLSSGNSSIVGILQNIGLYTEDIKCLYNNIVQTIPLKDKWSERYERETIKFSTKDFSGELEIRIPDSKKMVCKKLFYTGDSIDLISYE